MKKARIISIAILLLLLLSPLIFHPAVRETLAASPVPSTPEPVPTPTPEPGSEDKARKLMASMSLEEKVWQMLYVFPQDVVSAHSCCELETWADAMHCRGVGGIVINSENMLDGESLKTMLKCIKSSTDICPFIGVDEEGGKVARLAYTLGETTDLYAMYTYREQGKLKAYENAATIAKDLVSFGFNHDFAPVADVWTNRENTVIGERAYSHDPKEAARLVSSAVEGFSDNGIITTLKHFPGHGDTAEDSHFSRACSDKSLDELREAEFLPFISGIEAGADMIMIGHITLTQVDSEVPATLSKTIVTDILRTELGWNGVVITDSFKMAAITEYDECEAAVMAIEAGCDIILGPTDPDAVVQAIEEKVNEERINESILRILTLKFEKGLVE